jgi:hypothetical protein
MSPHCTHLAFSNSTVLPQFWHLKSFMALRSRCLGVLPQENGCDVLDDKDGSSVFVVSHRIMPPWFRAD